MTERHGMRAASRWNRENRQEFYTALIATVLFSLAAHGFLFTNEMFSHDSISYFTYSTGTPGFYLSIGRFAIPLYEWLKGAVAAPWLIGLLYMVWMTLASVLVCRVLDIHTRLGQVLTCGLLCTAPALSLTGATYIYCMDEYALALLLAACAVWCFQKGGWRSLPGLAALTVSLAIYQAYFTVAAVLLMLTVLRRLAHNETAMEAVRLGIRFLLLLAAAFLLYYALWTLLCTVGNVEKRRVGESVLGGGSVFGLLKDANVQWLRMLWHGTGVLTPLMRMVHIGLLLLLGGRLLSILRDGTLYKSSRILLVVLVCLLPTAFDSIYLLMSPENVTQLMTFGEELFYVLAVLALEPEKSKEEKRERSMPAVCMAAVVLLGCVLWQQTVYANQIYMKKDLDKNATVVLAARVLDRVELTEGYVPGETPVAFAGRLDQNSYLNPGRDAFSEMDHTVGLWGNYSATYNLGRYLTDYLNAPLLWDTEARPSAWPEVREMPVFPAQGSVALVRGTVVVKLSQD